MWPVAAHARRRIVDGLASVAPPAISQTMLDEGGKRRCPVPEGQDGKLCKFADCQGVRQLSTVPPYLAITGKDLLLPKEVVEADAKK